MTYKVIKQEGPMPSKRNAGSSYWDITLRDLKTFKIYNTYVDVDMKNFQHWTEILENPDIEYELDGLSVFSEAKRIVNADSIPRIVRGGGTFNDLFSE